MNHTSLIRLINDIVCRDGLLYHATAPTVRDAIKAAGRRYAIAHATGSAAEMAKEEWHILKLSRQ